MTKAGLYLVRGMGDPVRRALGVGGENRARSLSSAGSRAASPSPHPHTTCVRACVCECVCVCVCVCVCTWERDAHVLFLVRGRRTMIPHWRRKSLCTKLV